MVIRIVVALHRDLDAPLLTTVLPKLTKIVNELNYSLKAKIQML